ncbi:MAG: hypothetical protein ACI8Q1_002463 [Parvicella sp.]|jgi:hypothetical protein
MDIFVAYGLGNNIGYYAFLFLPSGFFYSVGRCRSNDTKQWNSLSYFNKYGHFILGLSMSILVIMYPTIVEAAKILPIYLIEYFTLSIYLALIVCLIQLFCGVVLTVGGPKYLKNKREIS